MLAIQTCPLSWPNHENCINMRFAVPLPPINSGNLTLEQLLSEGSVQYQLSTEHLERMWIEYGRLQFESNGIYVSQRTILLDLNIFENKLYLRNLRCPTPTICYFCGALLALRLLFSS